MEPSADSPWGDRPASRRVFAHVGAFGAGFLLSLAWNVPATLFLTTASAPGPAWGAQPLEWVLMALVGFVCSGAMAAGHVFARLSDAEAGRGIGLNNNYRSAALVGLGHGLVGIWPVLLLVQWLEQTGRLPSSANLYGVAATVAALIWFGATCFFSGLVTTRLVRLGPADAGRCPHCGYDVRASAGRCPECGGAILAGGPGSAVVGSVPNR